MCIIVDTNVLSILLDPNDKVGIQLREWLRTKGKTVIGGRYGREVRLNLVAAKYFAELVRQSRARIIPDGQLDHLTEELAKDDQLSSDDPHIIALAILSKARILFTHDQALGKDFKNKEIINNPRGCIYKSPSHAKLLKHHKGCAPD